MGRYYSGDIEGKFWFAVQSSDDADFFGCEGQSRYLDYYFDEDNLPDIKKGIKKCEKALGKDKAILDAFFKEHDAYNNEMIVQYYKDKHNETITDKDVLPKLQWYARLALGNQIWECVKENGSCNFEAEL